MKLRAAAVPLLILACNGGDPPALTAATDDTEGASMTGGASMEGGEPTGGEPTEPGPTTGDVATDVNAVDILFVVENNGSMFDAQTRMLAAVDSFLGPLTDAGMSLRIAVTTNDLGHPRCVNTGPENGAFLLTSCVALANKAEFFTPDGELAGLCLDACSHDAITTKPTAIAGSDATSPRPWLEWADGASNLEIPLDEALSCLLPQGLAGCGYVQPLESMRTALQRAQSAADPAYGFLRSNAHLLVILVGDGPECSYAPEAEAIFSTNKVFWSSPDDTAPNLAVCWNAGVRCTGGPKPYDDCVAADFGLDGAETDDPTKAALHSVREYKDMLTAIADAKDPGAKVQVVTLAGVPPGYPGTPLVYTSDDHWDAQLGVGPGCDVNRILAVPPTRVLDVAAQHSPFVQPAFSICDEDYSASFAAIATAVAGG